MFPWVDADGQPIDLDTDIRSGTKVRLIIDLKPYIYSNKGGLSFKVRGAQVIKLVTANTIDQGGLDNDDVADIFGKAEGFTQSSPAVKEPTKEPTEDDLPF
jgi:hypothetical protein